MSAEDGFDPNTFFDPPKRQRRNIFDFVNNGLVQGCLFPPCLIVLTLGLLLLTVGSVMAARLAF